MNPLILILAAEAAGPSMTWIQANAPSFLRPGHDIVATQNPSDEQIRAAYAIIIPEAQSYFAVVGRAPGKNIVFLDAGIDGRDFVLGGTHVRQTLHMCDWLIGTALGIARSERAAAESLRAEIAEKDAEIARRDALIARLNLMTPPAGTAPDALKDGLVWNPIANVAGSPEPEPDGDRLSPEAAAKIEFEAGREIALAGGTLLDLATDAAKDGFDSAKLAPPVPDAPAEPEGPGAPPEPSPDVTADGAPPAGVKKTIRDIRRKPASE